MKLQRPHRIAALAAAVATMALTLPAMAQAQNADPAATTAMAEHEASHRTMAADAPSRAEVRSDYQETRAAGAVMPDGEVGDTPRTLMAREQYSQAKGEELRAEYERQAAVDAAAAQSQSQPQAPMAPFGAQDSSIMPPTAPTQPQ
ncbi:hypothetical protein CKO44_20620 [Rubrivivax gelatinosus]|uniref:DUF4148 domain-containing protein n=1 Tax=Rubrivivax gelatinosus TaxID=28068 RepID=A0ABS1DZW9_RUBGE|nr:hypothetical protein [Rubrivivax gelatinosus]MBK1615861.1 hypothetical protein [Rubrivivax gelatinosus]MBK1714182.1 hypothetical protein [Rubrivivax gelatinosus]